MKAGCELLGKGQDKCDKCCRFLDDCDGCEEGLEEDE